MIVLDDRRVVLGPTVSTCCRKCLVEIGAVQWHG